MKIALTEEKIKGHTKIPLETFFLNIVRGVFLLIETSIVFITEVTPAVASWNWMWFSTVPSATPVIQI